MDNENPYLAPESLLMNTDERERVYQHKKYMIFDPRHQLPQRCIYCNKPSEVMQKRKLVYINPWWYLLIFINLLILLIVSLFVTKRFTVEVPLCAEHNNKSQKLKRTGWIILVLSFALFFAALAIQPITDGILPALLIGCMVLGFISLFFFVGASHLAIYKYKENNIWVKGCKENFLHSLPLFENRGNRVEPKF